LSLNDIFERPDESRNDRLQYRDNLRFSVQDTMMEVKHAPETNEGRFYVEGPQEDLGYLTYSLQDDTFTVEHTFVDDELKGTGAARKLVDEAVRFARENRYEIEANCEYAAHVIKKYY